MENYQLAYDLCSELLANPSILDSETRTRIQKNFSTVKEKIELI